MRTHIDAKPVVARQGSGGTAERQAEPETAVRLATLARGNTRAESPYRWANAQLLAARPQAPDHGPRMQVNSKIDKPVTSPVPVVQRVRGLLKGTRVKLKKNADDQEPGEAIIVNIVGDEYDLKQSPFADDEDSKIKGNYPQELVEPFFSIGASARANEPETKHSDDQATGDEKTAARTSIGSQSVALAAQGSTIVFANVSELYEAKATRILTLLSRHPTIMRFLNDRGSNCIITLVKGTVPGHVDTPIEEQGGDVQVRLATWYFEKYELGYVMAMLSHEFGIHPIANATIGTEETKNIPVEKGQQADHLVGANWTSSRNAVYRNLVLETALLMESDGATQVLDAFLMDCATILATNDRRAMGLLRSQLVADYYNEYRGYLENLIGQKANQQPEMKDLRLPPKKGADDVSLNYKQAASRLLTGYWSKASVKPQRSATDNRSASNRQQGQSAERNTAPSRTQSAPAQHSTDVKETKSSSPEIELTQFKRRPAVQPDIASSPASAAVNATRLPDRLAAGIEHLTGLAMDDVRVQYNSPKPAAVQALAYARGTEIHVGPGQEQHLPHEAWHVVQQKQARVKPTLQMKGIAINDDSGLEREAERMGGRAAGGGAASMKAPPRAAKGAQSHASNPVSQFMFSVAPRQGRSAGPVPQSQEVNPVYTGANKPEAVTLTINPGQHPSVGSKPDAVPDGWQTVLDLGLKGWVRFHVLNEKSGGSGDVKGNLTPTTQQVNQSKWKTFEAGLKQYINPELKQGGGAKWTAQFKAEVAYYGSSDDCAYVNDADPKKVVNVKGEHFPSLILATLCVAGEDLKDVNLVGKLTDQEGLIRPNAIKVEGWKLKQDSKQDVKQK